MSTAAEKRNLKVGLIAAAMAAGMVGAAYAAVPLYYAFCRATGFNGTTQVALRGPAFKGQRMLNVRFDANVAPGLDWTFEPETDSIELRSGVTKTVFFKVHNRSDKETASTAVYNVTPEISGAYFDKISCFCFSEQHLGPHETAELPVVFFLDPALDKDKDMNTVESITLSYTLFAARSETIKPVALQPTGTSKL
jgi:cytochrome c oxidase assembly protein subunit 11